MIVPSSSLGVVAQTNVFGQTAAAIESWARRSPFWATTAVLALLIMNLKRN